MNHAPSSVLTLFLIFSIQAQQKTAVKALPPTKPKTPTVSCTDAQTSKACRSFKQLIHAHDKDIMDSLASPTSYVCFRPKEDSFFVFHADEPGPGTLWQKSDNGLGETPLLASSVTLAEYRDGVLYSYKFSRDNWHRFRASESPVLHSHTTDGPLKGLNIDIEDVEISIEYPFKNQNSGTSQYSVRIRRSTGRFIETFASEGSSPIIESGTCLIYR